jgi:hypothetical protein
MFIKMKLDFLFKCFSCMWEYWGTYSKQPLELKCFETVHGWADNLTAICEPNV